MKTLYLIRHAKSSWKNLDLTDFERPLNGRGKKNAPFMGKVLRDKGIRFDLMVSSPAKRALKTAQKIADQMQYERFDIRREPDLYHAASNTIVSIIQTQPDHCNRLALIGHNPGFTAVANQLGKLNLENVPTAGIVAFSFDVSQWQDVALGEGQLLWFDYPKRYPENQ